MIVSRIGVFLNIVSKSELSPWKIIGSAPG
jgi:hypothetical protein